jgi:predicted AAA+ superfamily ATPase
MIRRKLELKLKYLAGKFPVVSLTGPRQSGKTTLIRHVFKDKPYLSLEDPDNFEYAHTDPRGFLKDYPDGVVLDEVQKVPALFSYIQTTSDIAGKNGMYILSGSQNFLLLEKISQSLAGRVAVLRLLPFSFNELERGKIEFSTYEEYIFKGFYPRLHAEGITPVDFYPYYISTYIERDVKQIKNITDTVNFLKFIRLCAARAGQILNYSSLSNETGVSVETIRNWIYVLEASYICFLLKPYYKNFNKRIIKSPKLYFYDTGIICSLLNIQSVDQLKNHYLKGNLFENLIIAEIIKKSFHNGKEPSVYFWQNKTGHEVDIVFDTIPEPAGAEIKSGKTFQPEFLKNLEYWIKTSKSGPEGQLLIYGGDQNQVRKGIQVKSWKKFLKQDFPF